MEKEKFCRFFSNFRNLSEKKREKDKKRYIRSHSDTKNVENPIKYIFAGVLIVFELSVEERWKRWSAGNMHGKGGQNVMLRGIEDEYIYKQTK